MGDEGIDQGSVRVTRRRMHNEASRFIDDNDVVVFKGDGEIHCLTLGDRVDRRRDQHADGLRLQNLRRRVAHNRVIHHNMARHDQRFEPRARDVVVGPGKELIQSQASAGLGDNKLALLA